MPSFFVNGQIKKIAYDWNRKKKVGNKVKQGIKLVKCFFYYNRRFITQKIFLILDNMTEVWTMGDNFTNQLTGIYHAGIIELDLGKRAGAYLNNGERSRNGSESSI
ncbi:MAG: hypothetical protein OXG87_10825 [Gemmatimonadetes bacterium]|nr:hypothetical protein [Gemmatimonadota bacterium]